MTTRPDPDLSAIDAALEAPPNPPAFPTFETETVYRDNADRFGTVQYIPKEGMSLRDYFAGQVIAGMFAAGSSQDDKAVIAYKWADAMLRARTAACIACLALALLTLPSLCQAQTAPEPTGMSGWAFWLAEAGQIADLVTTEIAQAHGVHESNVLMHYRAVRIPLKVLLPIATRYAFKDTPRSSANKRAIYLGVMGAGFSALNVTLTVKWGHE